MTAQRTPGPWQYMIGESGTRGLICTSTGETVVNIHAPSQIEPDVAFIVRACNAYDDLLAALTEVARLADAMQRECPYPNPRGDLQTLRDKARAAIARAEA